MEKGKFAGLVTTLTVGSMVAASNVMAAIDLTNVNPDTATVETLGATVLVGLGVIWGLRKLIKLVNRS